jgi:hypothetical protein
VADITKAKVPETAPAEKWIPKIIQAVILAEAIWGLIVSLTNNLILPALAGVMGGDPQSPLYLGKGDFNVAAIFSSILQLCLAGIVAVLLNHWSRPGGARVGAKTANLRAAAAKAPISGNSPSMAMPAPVSAPAAPAVAPHSGPVPPPMPSVAPQPKVATAQLAAPSRPEKPKKPKEVYYNIVGEPINPTEDE